MSQLVRQGGTRVKLANTEPKTAKQKDAALLQSTSAQLLQVSAGSQSNHYLALHGASRSMVELHFAIYTILHIIQQSKLVKSQVSA